MSQFSAMEMTLARLCIISFTTLLSCSSAAAQVAIDIDSLPVASFVFGDSLVEAGNNNYLPHSLSTANTPPFGIDFPAPNSNNPTGRFTNGLTIPDIVERELGATSLSPPFLASTTKGSAILGGVNYASGGGGILNDTGLLFIQRLSLDVQIGYFEQTVAELTQMLGAQNASRLLSRAIFSVTIGSNDFLNNYLLPVPVTAERVLAPQAFQQDLIAHYKAQLTRIYNGGARKLFVVNVPAIGCTPYQRTLRIKSGPGCAPGPNQLAQSFNSLLKNLVVELNSILPGGTFVYADAFASAIEIINNYKNYGFEDAGKACCGFGGPKKGLLPCRRFFPVCPDRSKYFFWDPYHPTQAANEILAHRFLYENEYTYPINIKQLAAM